MDEILLFANPIAGRGRGRLMADRIIRRLTREGYHVRAFFDPAEELPDRMIAYERPACAAIVVGGDGTLRAVVDRLLRAGESHVVPPLLIVPLGTANLMGKHLGVKWDDAMIDDSVARAIARRKIVALDAARANGRPFLLMAGVGIDAQIVHALERMRSGPIDITSYFIPAAMAFQHYEFSELSVDVDHRQVFTPRPAIAFVGNIPEYGVGFPMLPHARSDDELLDICVLPCASRVDLIRLFMHAAAGEHALTDGAVYVKGKHVRIESNKPMPVQVDGEAAGFTPVEIDLLPLRLPFILPA